MAGTSIKKFMDFIWGEDVQQEEYDDDEREIKKL